MISILKNGAEVSRHTTGSGTISLKMYKNSLIVGASYDGFIYAFDKKSGKDLNRIQGPGKPLLHFDISDKKVSFSYHNFILNIVLL